MFQKSKLSLALLYATGVVSTISSKPIYANENENVKKQEEVEKILVTGSRIKRIDMEGVAPVKIITSADIESSGLSSIAEVLQSSSVNSGVNFDGEGSFVESASSINLRGMGVNRTLVLINGRRQASFPTAAGGSTNFTDVSDIPSSAVERVELLTGGASAIYGSDAVGGVVNIILKKGYEGGKLELKHYNPTAGGRDESELALTYGMTTSKTESLFILEFKKTEELMGNQRKFLYNPAFYQNSYGETDWGVGPYGDAGASSRGAFLDDYDETFHDTDDIYATEKQCNNILGDTAVYLPELKYHCYYDDYKYTGVHSAYDRINLVFNTEIELSDDWSTFATIQGSRKKSDKFKEGKGISESIYMNIDTGDLAYSRSGMEDYAKFKVRRRFTDFPTQRIYKSTSQKVALVAGLSGVVFDEYDFDLSWSSGFNKYNRDKHHMVDAQGLLETITFDPNDNTGKWYPLDRITPEQAENIMGVSVTDSESSIHQLQSTVTGDLAELDAGPLSFASSIEWAKESYEDNLDEKTTTGQFIGQGGTGGAGDRTRYALAFEILAPLLDKETYGQSLELSAALRYDHYADDSDVGGALTPQIGFTYHPVDILLVRANWGKSFRAPDMHRLYSGETLGFSSTDIELPGGEVYEDYYDSYSKGNLALQEEKGEYWNIGFVAEFEDELSIALDIWSIELEGAVRTVSSNEVLEDSNYNLTNQYSSCRNFSGLGYIMETDEDGVENLMCMRRGPINAALEATNGVDFEIDKEFDLDKWGELDFIINISYIDEKTYQEYANGPIEDTTETYYIPNFKGDARLKWRYDNLSVALSYYYTGSVEGEDIFEYEDGTEELATDTLDSHATINLNVSYKLPWDGKVSLGAKNLTDKMPPIYSLENEYHNNFPFYPDHIGYNVIGRTVYLKYSQSF